MKIELDLNRVLRDTKYQINWHPDVEECGRVHLSIAAVTTNGATLEEAVENLFEFAIERLTKGGSYE